ncbi:MAG: DUF2148 domain-containing protein [Bacteroidota bacterium]
MPIQSEENLRTETLLKIAKQMMLAARTAPKARGIDHLEIAIAERQNIKLISQKMHETGTELNLPSFLRDADNILQIPVMMLIGTKIKSMGLKKCGHCGFSNCEEKDKYPGVPCTFNTGDLGIAIGSAVSIAMDHRVDNRIMYSVGDVVVELGLLGKDVKIAYGIPLSATSKNPFFDRK